MYKIETTDNNLGERFITIGDNGDGGLAEIDEAIREVLFPYAGIELRELVQNNPGLFVFPPDVGDNDDGIEGSCLYSLPGGKLTTHNIAGVFSVGKGTERVQLSIRSRFDKDNPRQFFLMAMLKKVLGLNLLDLPSLSRDDRIWDLLPCLLPYYLKRAMGQGLFRCYRNFKFNGSEVRGTIDVGRHIDENIPFRGTVAYEMREHTENNAVVHLVRHAIEMVSRDPIFRNVLIGDEETRKAVAQIRMATPDFSPNARARILSQNSREIRHPYYTYWTDLQQLCLRILRRDQISFNGEGEGVYGVVFDVAWLWEEYLACCLRDAGLNFEHAQNKAGEKGIQLFEGGKRDTYPDFYSKECRCILDAKYKHLEGHNPSRTDLYQMISYIHILPGDRAILLYPLSHGETSEEENEKCRWEEKRLCGMSGLICKLAFEVPTGGGTENFTEYCKGIDSSFKKSLVQIREICIM